MNQCPKQNEISPQAQFASLQGAKTVYRAVVNQNYLQDRTKPPRAAEQVCDYALYRKAGGGKNGGLNPLYQIGGTRFIQLALKLIV